MTRHALVFGAGVGSLKTLPGNAFVPVVSAAREFTALCDWADNLVAGWLASPP